MESLLRFPRGRDDRRRLSLFIGGTDPDLYAKAKAAGKTNEIPTNHNPRFAPVLDPTLHTGVETMVTAAQAWLRS